MLKYIAFHCFYFCQLLILSLCVFIIKFQLVCLILVFVAIPHSIILHLNICNFYFFAKFVFWTFMLINQTKPNFNNEIPVIVVEPVDDPFIEFFVTRDWKRIDIWIVSVIFQQLKVGYLRFVILIRLGWRHWKNWKGLTHRIASRKN